MVHVITSPATQAWPYGELDTFHRRTRCPSKAKLSGASPTPFSLVKGHLPVHHPSCIIPVECRDAALIITFFAGRRAGALGENNNGSARCDGFACVFQQLSDCGTAGPSVDTNGTVFFCIPTKKGQPKELSFHDDG